MRGLSMLRSIALGLLLGFGGWRGVEHLLRQATPARLLERAVSEAPAPPASGLTAVLVFGPAECPQVMGVVELLNDLAGEEVRVVGALTVEEYRLRDWHLLVEAQRIAFPVFRLDPGSARASTASLGYNGGPLLLVFDRDGRILLATDALVQRGLRQFLEDFRHRFATPDHRRTRA